MVVYFFPLASFTSRGNFLQQRTIIVYVVLFRKMALLICYLLTTAAGSSSELHLHRHARERQLVGTHGANTTGSEVQVGSLLAQCGVATVAIYFPGFHQSVDNDMLWGEKWTEWDNLFTDNGSFPLFRDSKAHHELLHPQRGYYDIWDKHARTIRAQAQQAAAAGFQAFMFCAPLSDRYLIATSERAY